MLKLKKGQSEYEIIGQITFDNGGVEQTNYTIVIDGVTTTIESTDTQWEVIEVPDPEPVVELEPESEPVVTPEPAPEEEAATLEREQWLAQWREYVIAKNAIDKLAEAGIEPTAEESAGFETLKIWIATNRKPEYRYFI